VLSDISDEIETLSAMTGGDTSRDDILSRRMAMGKRMSECAAFLRNEAKLQTAIAECREELLRFTEDYRLQDEADMTDALINRDVLQTQLVYFGAILDYIADGGKSRGSYLLLKDGNADLLSGTPEIDTAHAAFVQNTALGKDFSVTSFFEPVRPLPESDQWFENVWNRFRKEN
jgi:hypothetical protein